MVNFRKRGLCLGDGFCVCGPAGRGAVGGGIYLSIEGVCGGSRTPMDDDDGGL